MHIVYGGAFNPPTLAHLEVYRFLSKKLELESFTYLPVSSAYTKGELASNHHRLNMLELMTAQLDNVRISDLEIQDTEFLGTYQSLVRLSDGVMGTFAFVIGVDNLKTLKHWKMAESLLSEFKIIVLNRQSISIEALINTEPMLIRHRHNLIVFDDFDVAVSSTKFRKTRDASMVHDAVWRYVETHDLYRR